MTPVFALPRRLAALGLPDGTSRDDADLFMVRFVEQLRERNPGVRAARDLYMAGRIGEDELERRLEQALLRAAPRDHPVPDGWEPVPPCEHDWVEITALGVGFRELLCTLCGEVDAQ